MPFRVGMYCSYITNNLNPCWCCSEGAGGPPSKAVTNEALAASDPDWIIICPCGLDLKVRDIALCLASSAHMHHWMQRCPWMSPDHCAIHQLTWHHVSASIGTKQ
jgi:hypothetical protein